MENLLKYIEKHKFNINKNSEEFKEISHLTSFLNEYYKEVSLSQRIWHLKHNLFETQKCIICNNILKYYRKGYNNTCSKQCQNKYQESEIFKENNKNIFLKKYGVEHSSKSINIKEKQRKTNLERYGVENQSYRQTTHEKIKQICLERYGVENFSQSQYSKIISNKNSISKYQQKLLDNGYINYKIINYISHRLYSIKCPKCNQLFEFNTMSLYQRIIDKQEICTHCNPINKNYSYLEKGLLDYIKSIYQCDIIENNKIIINPYEIDIYIPEIKLAIEFNGLYYHSDIYKNDNYHKIKTNLCNEQDIRLIHIFEDDWLYKTNIIKSILQTAISPQSNTKIFARKCEIKEINLKDTNYFLEENHINGGITTQTICYGLYYYSELISLMSFKKNKNKFELQRYAIKLNTTIIGGAEKLFKKANLQNCITYCDISLFTGKIYEKLGFKLIRRNKPNFMFVTKQSRITKQSIRKLKQGYKRKNDPYPRIYNCGIDVYEFNK